ncbi:MAG: ABC transporter permease [Spirochaetia bacterium]
MQLISATILQTAIAIATPLFIGALGGLYCERVGVVNVGLDGIMLMGAFAAAVVSYATGSAWIGVMAGCAAGALLGLLHALVCVTFKADHVISGVAINIMSSSATLFLLQYLFHNKGQSPAAPQVGSLGSAVTGIPLVGVLFQNMNGITLLGLFLVAASHLFITRTKIGLRLRSVGENPYAAQSLGIPVRKYMYLSVMAGCAMTGLGGAFLSIGMLNVFTKNMTAGRGYIALAALVVGRWKPFGLLAAALLFGYVSAWQMSLGGFALPAQLIEAIPYAAAVIMLAFVSRRAFGPAHSGKRFSPDEN